MEQEHPFFLSDQMKYAWVMGAIYLRDHHITDFAQMSLHDRGQFRVIILCSQRHVRDLHSEYDQIMRHYTQLLRQEPEMYELMRRDSYLFLAAEARFDGRLMIGETSSYDNELHKLGIRNAKKMVAQLKADLETLSEDERAVIELRYGLTDGRAHSIEEISLTLHLTRDKAQQFESYSLHKLHLLDRSRLAAHS